MVFLASFKLCRSKGQGLNDNLRTNNSKCQSQDTNRSLYHLEYDITLLLLSYACNFWIFPFFAFFLVCCGCDTSYIVSVHIQCQASIYTLSLCRGHSWRVRLAKQETLTPPGHLVSPLVFRGPWMSTVVLYCWCHSDSASVLLYFTFVSSGVWRCVWHDISVKIIDFSYWIRV